MKKVSELQVGQLYVCTLSGLRVLIIAQPAKTIQTMQGSEVIEWKILGVYYNPMTGCYNTFVPMDDQLNTIA